MPHTPPTSALLYNVGYLRKGAALPNPIVLAASTFHSLTNVLPPSRECQMPYTVVVLPPASHRSPSRPGVALNCAEVPAGGRLFAAVAANVWPPSVLM